MESLVDKFEAITGVPFFILFQVCFVISIEVLGFTQFLKNFIKKDLNRDRYRYSLSIACFITCLICAIMNTTLVHPIITRIFDFFMLSLAITQMAHDTIIKTVPRAIETLVDKTIGSNISKD